MAKMKTAFFTEKNSAYPNQKGVVNIIGKAPEDSPYLSLVFQNNGGEIAHGWLPDKDLERFAVNILKAIKSKKLK